jgi:hypothetical protein
VRVTFQWLSLKFDPINPSNPGIPEPFGKANYDYRPYIRLFNRNFLLFGYDIDITYLDMLYYLSKDELGFY